ncbi:MAG TPA: cyanophycin synthetase [Gemmatimonadales bacterium]
MTYPTRIAESTADLIAPVIRPGDLTLEAARALRGPNPWNPAPVVVGELRLGRLAGALPLHLPGFLEGVHDAFPSLCAELGADGETLLVRRPMGALLPSLVQRVALHLQSLAGCRAGFGRILPGDAGAWTVVVAYEEEEVGIRALEQSVELVRAALDRRPVAVSMAVAELAELLERTRLGPSTRAIVEEARRRGIPVRRMNDASLVQLGTGRHQRRIEAAVTERTSGIAMEIAQDKEATKRLLADLGLPTPRGATVHDVEKAVEVAESLGYPVVLKPDDGNHGRGVSGRVGDAEALRHAWHAALTESTDGGVIVERFVEGRDHRVLVVGGRVVACAERVPAQVVGDGRRNIRALIDRANRDPRRGAGHARSLTRLPMDATTEACLACDGRTLDTVPAAGEVVQLRRTANLSTGGTSVDRTDELHPDNALACVLAARAVGLDVAGVDVVSPDVGVPFADNDGAIIEVNAGPGLRMHTHPTEGRARDVAGPIVDLLFPPGAPVRVPVVAVTGTNGKTTTTRLVAHLMRRGGQAVGYTTTDGVYFEDRLLTPGDMTGPVAAAQVLANPLVDAAVLEVARGGILRAGLGFDECDVGVVLNVASDHLGLRGVHTLEQLAEVKGTIAAAVVPEGWAVLNADDPRVLAMRERTRGRVALLSTCPPGENGSFEEHLATGGVGARVERGAFVLHRWGSRVEIATVHEVPLTFGGAARFQLQNVLAALLAAHLCGVTTGAIREGLRSFAPSPESTPGRMNLVRVGRGHVLVDYAHNAAAVEALTDFVRGFDARCRVGVVACPGDRRDEDIREVGRLCAPAFDRVIVKEDEDRRGRAPGEVARLLREGLYAGGMDRDAAEIAAGEEPAVARAIELVAGGGLAVVLADDVRAVLDQVRRAAAADGP